MLPIFKAINEDRWSEAVRESRGNLNEWELVLVSRHWVSFGRDYRLVWTRLGTDGVLYRIEEGAEVPM